MDINKYLMEYYIEHNGKTIAAPIAHAIVEEFAITDGDRSRMNGEKWTIEETTEAAESLNVDFDKISKIEWYIVLNNEYSDKYSIVQKYNLPTPNAYFDFALAWFNDVDAKEDKTFKYFFC